MKLIDAVGREISYEGEEDELGFKKQVVTSL